MRNKTFLPKVVSSIFVCSLLTSCTVALAHDSKKAESFIQLKESEVVEKKINLSYPVNGEETSILKPSVMHYINDMHAQAQNIEDDYVLHDFYITGVAPNNHGEVYNNETDVLRIADYWNSSLNEEKSKKVALVFDAVGFEEETEFKVIYGMKQDLSDGVEITTNNSFVTISNLLANQTYYWKVTSGNTQSEVQSFKTQEGFRMISAGGVTNVRDMGGRPVKGGKHIKQGLIFRGGELVRETYTVDGSTHSQTLYDNNIGILQDDIAIKYEVDLRGDAESNNITQSDLKDENHDDVDYLRIPNLRAYDYFFTSSATTGEHKELIKQMFLAFKDAQNKHVYFHCWGGADRTGTVGFLLGGLLGMSYTDLIIDYELTSFSCNYRPHNVNDPNKVYRFPALIYQMKNATNLVSGEKYWTATKPISQIIEEMLIDRIGLTSQDIVDIKANLLED